MTLAVAPAVLGLPSGYGVVKLFAVNAKQLVRFGCTNLKVASVNLDSYRLANAATMVGTTDPAAWTNKSFWFKKGVDSSNFEVYIDRTDQTVVPSIEHRPVHAPSVEEWNAANRTWGTISDGVGRGQFITAAIIAASRDRLVYDGDGTFVASQGYLANESGTHGFGTPFLPTVLCNTTYSPRTGETVGLRLVVPAEDAAGIRMTFGTEVEKASSWVTVLPMGNSNLASGQSGPVAYATTLYSAYHGQLGYHASGCSNAEFSNMFGCSRVTGTSGSVATSHYTHPGRAGFEPAFGVYMHGLHPSVRSFKVVGGQVVECVVECTPRVFSDIIRGFSATASTADAAMLQSTANQVETSLGGKPVKLLLLPEPVGPFDIYQCREIQAALADDAEISDIDEYTVSGTRCDAWRVKGNSATASSSLAWVAENKTVVACHVTKAANGTPLFSPGIPAGTTAVLITTVAYGAAGGFADGTELLAACELAYPAISFMKAGSIDSIRSALRTPNSNFRPSDMPKLWWSNLGFTNLAGVVGAVRNAVFVPSAPA